MPDSIVPIAEPPPLAMLAPTPADRNPVLVYLARLGGETSAVVMARCLKRIAKVIAAWMGEGASGVSWEALPWASLRYQHVAALRAKWQRDGLMPRTVNHLLAAVMGVLDEAENLGLLPPDEAARLAAEGLAVTIEMGLIVERYSLLEFGRDLATARGDHELASRLDTEAADLAAELGIRRSTSTV